MKSLFLRIFLSFWMAIALFVVLTYSFVAIFRQQRNPTWEALRTTALSEAIAAYEHGGESEARDYLTNLEATQHVRVHVFDEHGREISGRHAPTSAQSLALGKPIPPREGIVFPPPRILTESRASSDGQHRYVIALMPPPGPRFFFAHMDSRSPGWRFSWFLRA